MRLRRVLLATDFSTPSRDAFVEAVSLARREEARLTIVHVHEPLPSLISAGDLLAELFERTARRADEVLDEWRREAERLGVAGVEARRVDGVAWHEIVEIARATHADAIVVGTHGRTGVRHALVGSVAEKVVRHAPCTVVVVRPKGE
jgi:nucleotide-binding universal stress UspA family protein